MKLTKLLLTLSLCMMLLVPTAMAETYTVEDMFSIEYDETAYEMDDSSYTDENTDEYSWLFLIFSDDVVIEATIEQNEDFEGYDLTTLSDEELDAYVEDTIEAFSDSEATFLESVEVGDDKIPFYLFSMKDDEGSFLMAETVLDGVIIDFTAFYDTEDAVEADEALREELVALLDTFAPEA